jgi:hypothetical protein
MPLADTRNPREEPRFRSRVAGGQFANRVHLLKGTMFANRVHLLKGTMCHAA